MINDIGVIVEFKGKQYISGYSNGCVDCAFDDELLCAKFQNRGTDTGCGDVRWSLYEDEYSHQPLPDQAPSTTTNAVTLLEQWKALCALIINESSIDNNILTKLIEFDRAIHYLEAE